MSDGRRRRSFFFTMREGTSEAVREGGREGSPIVETGEGEKGRALQWLLAAHGNERQNR